MVLGTTLSVCPVCGVDSPAVITEGEHVYLDTCCVLHGMHRGVLEKNPMFYRYLRMNWSPSIYDGVLVDVTRRCNARCSYCFQDLNAEPDPSIEEIVAKVQAIPAGYPVILSGGEPTVRKDLPALVEALRGRNPVVVLTNGFHVDSDLPVDWVLSHHEETEGLFEEVVAGATPLHSIIFTATDEIEFLRAARRIVELGYRADNYRIHSAAPVGAHSAGTPQRMYLSDMIRLLSKEFDVELVGPGKTVYFPIRLEGLDVKLVSWSSKNDIDLVDLACPPYYLTDRGMEHLVTTLVKRGFC